MKKFLSFMFALILCIACLSTEACVFAASDIWDGTVSESFKYGSGTEADPYIISDGADLALLAKLINSGDSRNGFFKLVADIKLNNASGSSLANDARVWTPIGPSAEMPFDGTFDGNHHTISGIYIKSPDNNHALFGVNEGIIKNLRITDSIIEGKQNVGGVAAVNYGSISGCSFDGSITAVSEAGGIVGVNSASAVIENCRNKGMISAYTSEPEAEATVVGGISGTNCGIIKNSYNQGTVMGDRYVGGISGECIVSAQGVFGKIENCYNTGGLFARNGIEMGGITASTASTPDNHLSNCIYSSGTAMKGVNGYDNAEGIVVAHNTTGLSLKESYTGFDFEKIWTTDSTSGYPELRVFKTTSEPFTPPVIEAPQESKPSDDGTNNGQSSDNTSQPAENTSNTEKSEEEKNMSIATLILIGGLLLGCVIFLAVIAIIVIILVKNSKKSKKSSEISKVVPAPAGDDYSQALGGGTAPSDIRCNTCGSAIPNGIDYCPKCGMPVMTFTAPAPKPAAPAPSAPTSQPSFTPYNSGFEQPTPSFEPQPAPSFAPAYEEPVIQPEPAAPAFTPSFEPQPAPSFAPVYEEPAVQPEPAAPAFTPSFEPQPAPSFAPVYEEPAVQPEPAAPAFTPSFEPQPAPSFAPVYEEPKTASPELNFSPAYTAPAPSASKKTCSKCGSEIAEGYKFCVKCGASASEPEAPKAKFCASCGKPVEPGFMFCSNCGAKTN